MYYNIQYVTLYPLPFFLAAQLLQWAAKLLWAELAAPLLLLLLLLRILGWTIVCSATLPSPGLELATAQLALANQQLSLLGRTCFSFWSKIFIFRLNSQHFWNWTHKNSIVPVFENCKITIYAPVI